MTTTRIAIHGAGGRMGNRLVALASQDAELELAAALEHDAHPDLGKDAGLVAGAGEIGVPLTAALEEKLGAVIDFSIPAPAVAITQRCQELGTPLVMATTGLTDEQRQIVTDAATEIPIVWAPNMSLAVNLTMKLATDAARTLRDAPGGADVEVIERHHRFKEDAPSGTALRFGEMIAEVMGQTEHRHGRQGIVGQRPHGEVGYHALRVGDNPGEHTIVFGLLGETIELTVRATNRDCYALGALAAAKFVSTASPGIYSMADVLGL